MTDFQYLDELERFDAGEMAAPEREAFAHRLKSDAGLVQEHNDYLAIVGELRRLGGVLALRAQLTAMQQDLSVGGFFESLQVSAQEAPPDAVAMRARLGQVQADLKESGFFEALEQEVARERKPPARPFLTVTARRWLAAAATVLLLLAVERWLFKSPDPDAPVAEQPVSPVLPDTGAGLPRPAEEPRKGQKINEEPDRKPRLLAFATLREGNRDMRKKNTDSERGRGAAGTLSRQDSLRIHLNKASGLIDSRQYQKALLQLAEVRRLDLEDNAYLPMVLALETQCYLELGRRQDARANLDEYQRSLAEAEIAHDKKVAFAALLLLLTEQNPDARKIREQARSFNYDESSASLARTGPLIEALRTWSDR